MPSRGTMVCCFSHGVLTRAEREAIAKLRERREQGRVPGTTTHVATADRMDPLVSFYSSGHLVTTPTSRTKLLPGPNATHANSRPSAPARNNNSQTRHHKQHHGNARPTQPNYRANRPDPRRQKQPNHDSPQTHSRPGGSAGTAHPHTPRSATGGSSHSHTLPGPSGSSHTTSGAKAVAVGTSTDVRPGVSTKPQRSKTQHRVMERRPGAGVPASRAHTTTTRAINASNVNGHQDKFNGTVLPVATKEALKSKTSHTTGTVIGATGAPPPSAPPLSAPPPPPPALSSQKASKTCRPPAPPPPIPPRVKQHVREGGSSGKIVKMRSEGPNQPRKPVTPNHKAKSFGDSDVKTKDNSLRSNAHARTDVRPLHIAEAAPPRVRVNVRTANNADWRRQRREGRTAGPGSAFAAVSAALGRRRGALQPSAAIVDTSIADAVATPSGVRARERVADRRGGNGPRVGKGHARRDVAPVTQGVSTMLKALTLLHVSRTAGMAGTPKSKARSQAADETDTDEDVDSDVDKEKENENRGNERKVGRIAWASKKRLEDVMSKLAGQSSKGERFVMKARPQLSDLTDAKNDVYFQKIMNDDH